MKKLNNQYRKQLLTRLYAFLLLALFVNAIAIQGLHYHHNLDQPDHHNKVESVQNVYKVDASKLSCKLCDLIKHQSTFYELPSIYTAVIFLENATVTPTVYVAHHPIAYVLAATNKGPPAITA